MSVTALLFLLQGLETASPHAGGHPNELFVIERTKNRNVVVYEARVDDVGNFSAKEPVNAYWLMLEKQGQREDLNVFERARVYGFDTRCDGAGCLMIIRAIKTRPIKLLVEPHEHEGLVPRAIMRIADKDAVLELVTVETEKGKDHVLAIEFCGEARDGSGTIHERVVDPK